ncbi:hypothetical protein Bca101_012063 [Brassica carinata]
MEDYGRQRPYGGMQVQPYNGGPCNGDFRSYSASYGTATENNMYDVKKGKSIERSKSWGITDPELQRKKRVASYKMYSVEGKVKGSFRKSFRWLKHRYTQVIRAYAVNKPWALGFLMDIFGALLMLRALSLAPEVMNVFDWIGITVAGIGTIGFSAVGVGAGGEEQKASLISVFQLLWLALVVLLNAWLHIYKRQRREQELMEYEVVEEIIYGLESGVLFGMASVVSKMGFVFVEQGFSAMFIPMCISISICCSGTGFFYQTRGLKHGRAIVVSTCAAVASIVTGVVAGMFALGEKLPSSPSGRLLLLLGWCCITGDFITTYQTSSKVIPAVKTDECRKRFQHKADNNISHAKGYKPKCGYPSSNTAPSLIIRFKRERLRLRFSDFHLLDICSCGNSYKIRELVINS